jgi:F0F1-type ATP synthase delta subunit
MPTARDYYSALSEAISETELPLALEHILLAHKSITPSRKQELENAQNIEERKKLLDLWLGEYVVSPVKNLAALIAEAREWNLLSQLVEIIKTEGEEEARVTTAKPLSNPLKKLIRSELAKISEIKSVAFKEDKTLIGGVRIQLGNRQIDYSIKNRLTKFFNP